MSIYLYIVYKQKGPGNSRAFLFIWRAEQDSLAKVINGVKAWLNTEEPRLLLADNFRGIFNL
jgi:hypothetical protein